MASRSRSSSGGTANKIVWFLVVGGLIFAFFQIPYDPGVKGVMGVIEGKSKTVQSWAENAGPNIAEFFGDMIKGGDSPQSSNPEAPSYTPYEPNTTGTDSTVEEVSGSLKGLTVAEAEKVSYDRDEWNHWTNVRSCWTVREAVLVRDAVAGSVVLKDKDGKETTNVDAACEVTGGKWIDPYSGKEFTNPKDLDIDHMVPLKYTATHGGQAWDKGKKEQYANDMSFPSHLLAVSASENRSKSDKGPGSWKPSNYSYQCQYATSWITVSKNYGLTVSSKDADTLNEMLKTCS